MPAALADLIPTADEMTVEAVPFATFEALPEGIPAQYIDGYLYVSPAPLLRHQDVVQNLYRALFAYAERAGGYAAVAPVDVKLGPETVLQPDVVYVGPEQVALLGEREIEFAPVFVAEVLSPSTAYFDLSKKRRAFEAAGVREYWVLDPAERSAEVLTLTEDGFRTASRRYETGRVASVALEGFVVEASDLFRRPGA